MVGFINGIAMGAGVVIARYYGAKKRLPAKAIHTTVAFGLVAGAVLTVLGMFLAPKILVLMGTPADVLPESIVYFRTYLQGLWVLSCTISLLEFCSRSVMDAIH